MSLVDKLKIPSAAVDTAVVLIIHDSWQDAEMLREALSKNTSLMVIQAEGAENGFELFQCNRPRIVLLSFATMPLFMNLLERIIRVDPGANVILCSRHYSSDEAVEAIREGACDYLTMPTASQKLLERIETLCEEAELRKRTLSLDRELLETCQFEGIVSRSPLMLAVFAKVRRVAPHFKTALITGATGTGKELIARALHRHWAASEKPFVVCNCSALVESLAESEMFGYVRGSFTGATQDRAGLFESAHGGSIFLDEIGELSLGNQAKLLRVLQDRRVQRVGSSTSRSIEVRVIAATNRELRKMVSAGTFREDLFYRLAVVEIALPHLVYRREDLPLLERHFIEKYSKEFQRPICGLTLRAQALLTTYPWPGNIRELENVLSNACMMTDGKFIDIDDLPQRLRERRTWGSLLLDEALCSLEEVERRHVVRVLDSVEGNKMRAAEILGISRTTIYQLLSRLRLETTHATA